MRSNDDPEQPNKYINLLQELLQDLPSVTLDFMEKVWVRPSEKFMVIWKIL